MAVVAGPKRWGVRKSDYNAGSKMTGIWSDQTAIRVPLALIGLGAIGTGAALLLAMGAAVQRTVFEGEVSAAQVAAVHLAGALNGHARAVGEVAERVASVALAADRGQTLRTWLARHQLQFAGLAIVDNGSQNWVEVRQPCVGAALGTEVAELSRATLLRRSAVARMVEDREGGAAVVLLATPIPRGGGDATDPAGALVACLAAESVGGPVLDALAAHGHAAAFLTSEDGLVLLTRAPHDSSGEDAGGQALARGDLASLVADAVAGNLATKVVSSSGRTLLGTAVRFDAVGSAWVVGAARPWRMSFAKADRFLLLAGLGTLILLAGAIGVVAAVRRGEKSHQGGEEEARRWRATAEAAMQDAWRRALLTLPGFPVVEIQGTRIVEANARAARYLGAGSAAVLEGRDFLELVASRDRERLARFLAQEIPEGGDEEALTVSLVGAGGGRRIADLRRLPRGDARAGTVLLSWRDGTGRERGEALARTLSTVMPVPLVFVDASGTLVWSNQAFAETARRLGVKVSTPSITEVFRPTDRRLLRVMFAAALRGKDSERLMPLAVGGGEQLAVVVRSAPVLVAGEVFGVVFAGQEVRAAPPGAVSLDQPQRAEALAQLAAGLSHRLNNDIQALQGLIAAAPGEEKGDFGEAVIARLRLAARELQRFVSVCRRSGGALRPTRLSALLDDWRTARAPQMPAGVRLVLNCEVTEDRVVVDARQIESFLEYALAAVTSYLEGQGGSVHVAVERGVAPGTVRLSVRDTGEEPRDLGTGSREGLPEAMAREAVLAVAQLVAQRHGGAAGWRRPAGVGSHVWIDLPLSPGAVTEHPVQLRERRRGLVMVADDEEMVRTSLADALREEGFAVEEASNGAEVLERILAAPGRYALLVLDLVMPVVDGREVYRRLAREVPGLPVLLCTGYDAVQEDDLVGADVVVKPCSLEAFVERVRNLTDSSPATVIG